MAYDFKRIWTRIKAFDFEALTDRELYFVFGIAFALLIAIAVLAFRFIEPPPPKVVKITTGSETGAYFAYGKQYAKALEKHGIRLEVLTSQGSVQNLERLRDKSAGIHAGFIQSGAAGERAEDDEPGIESLASVAYEPVWVFHRGDKPLGRLPELAGRRVAIGAEGSGVRLVADALLKAAGIDASRATLEPLGPAAATPALREGKIDAAIVIAAFTAPIVQSALAAGLQVMNFEEAEAYSRHFPWLQRVTLPKGAANLAKNEPPQDITLLANTTSLVVRSDIHPAIAYLLMDVATAAHGKSGLFNGLKEFPSIKSLDFPQSEESKRYLASGRPFLQRYLPFWLANLVERLSVSLVPMLLILIPLLKAIPGFIHWREASHLARIYDEIKHFEHHVNEGKVPPEAIGPRIEAFESKLDHVHLNSPYLGHFYDMKGHLDMLKARYGAAPQPA